MQRLEIDNKGKQYGHNVSHSKRHTRKVWKPNLQIKTLMINGNRVKAKVSTHTIRSLKKKGLL
jgi:large subunit ribosomal protein L28